MTSIDQVRAPGPRGIYGIRNLIRFGGDPLARLRELTDRHGDLIEMKVLGRPWFVLNHPDDIEYALVKQARIMGRDDYIDILQRVLGMGLLTSDGPLWRQQRKLMSPAFSPKRISGYAETMVEVAEAGLCFGHGETINLHEEMSRLTMEVVAAVLFGAGLERAQIDLVRSSMETVNKFFSNSPEAIVKLPWWIPTPLHLRLREAVTQLDGLIFSIIDERRRGAPRDDLLGTLLSARDEEGATMSDRQLRDEAITLFLAGHETTALALAHTFYLLSKHPEVERRLVAELTEVLGARAPTAADVKRLTFTERVLKEAMRLYPPAWTAGREALEDFEIRGYRIPRGAQLMMSQWIVHRDPRWFPDPEAFDPDRWLPDRAAALPRYAYFPFGGGPRTCIGNHFAMMEATLLLALVAQRYHLELLPAQRLELKPSVTLRPRGAGLSVRVFHREPPAVSMPRPVSATA